MHHKFSSLSQRVMYVNNIHCRIVNVITIHSWRATTKNIYLYLYLHTRIFFSYWQVKTNQLTLFIVKEQRNVCIMQVSAALPPQNRLVKKYTHLNFDTRKGFTITRIESKFHLNGIREREKNILQLRWASLVIFLMIIILIDIINGEQQW